MSTHAQARRATIRDIAKGATPSVWLTCYTASQARFLDPHTVDVLLVGDLLGMVLYGYPSTLPVTLDMMIQHGAAVMRGKHRARWIVVDMPFGSYQESPSQAFRNSARVLAETGCAAVKLEGGTEMAETVHFLAQRGVLGLRPYRPLRRNRSTASAASARKARRKRKRLAHPGRRQGRERGRRLRHRGRGCPGAAGKAHHREAIPTPTIGIGASVACDGQVLVAEDALGLFADFTPRFVKRYANLGEKMSSAVAAYAEEVRTRKFPGPEHCFGMPKG